MRCLQMSQVQPTTPKRAQHRQAKMLPWMASVNGRQSTWSVPGPETRREGVVGRVWGWIACHPWPCRHKQRSGVSIASSFSTGLRREGRVPSLSTISPWPFDCPPVRFLTRAPPLPLSLLPSHRYHHLIFPAPKLRSCPPPFAPSSSPTHGTFLRIDPRSKFDRLFAHTLLRKEPHSLLFSQTRGRRLQAGLPALRPPTTPA